MNKEPKRPSQSELAEIARLERNVISSGEDELAIQELEFAEYRLDEQYPGWADL